MLVKAFAQSVRRLRNLSLDDVSVLIGDTIEAVRTMLPAGLRRMDRMYLDPVETVEAWI